MAPARVLLFAAAAACVLVAPLSAQHITSPYRYIESRQSIFLFAGPLRTQTGGAGLGPTSGNIFGAAYGYRVSGPFVIEATLGYAPLKRVARDTTHLASDTTVFHAVGTSPKQGVLVASADLRFNITGARTWYGLQPYLSLGGGGAISTSGENGGDSLVPADARFKFGTSFAAQAGGGIEWYATRQIGLRLDARGTLWKLHTPQAFLIRESTLPQSEWTQNVSLTGGLAIHF